MSDACQQRFGADIDPAATETKGIGLSPRVTFRVADSRDCNSSLFHLILLHHVFETITTMTRLRRIMLLMGLVSLLVLPKIDAMESKSLTVVQQRTGSKFQSPDETIALLDHGGRAQVVHIPRNEAPISLPTRPGKQRRISHIKASLLTIGLFASLVRNVFFVEAPTRNDWASFGFLLILYLVESATCSTRRYLSNIRTPSEVKDYIRQLQEVPPRVRFHLECYHYEDDSFRYHSTSQHRHDSNSSSKRVTHRTSELFEFQK